MGASLIHPLLYLEGEHARPCATAGCRSPACYLCLECPGERGRLRALCVKCGPEHVRREHRGFQ